MELKYFPLIEVSVFLWISLFQSILLLHEKAIL